jgi:protease-4
MKEGFGIRKFFGTVFILLLVLFFGSCVFMARTLSIKMGGEQESPSQSALLHLKLEGVIIAPEEFLENLKKYSKEPEIKGVLVEINSPGGVVGPSQEIHRELKRIREELKKPVVVSISSLGASGAYYSAVAADKIFVNSGSLVGSIGVIMEFANLEQLYEWAKVSRYVIKTGAYKDSGAEYRPMRDDEKALFQQMADEILEQFKKAIADGRKLPIDRVARYADGRVFTGQTAINIGFADEIGTVEDARRALGQLAGMGADPEMFEPPEDREKMFFDLLGEAGSKITGIESAANAVMGLTRAQLTGLPLLLMPGTYIGNMKGQ